MRALKVICGVICLFAMPVLTLFALECYRVGEMWLVLFAFLYILGFTITGYLLIDSRSHPLSKGLKIFMTILLIAVIGIPAILDVKIRYDRAKLQARAKTFMLRPLPMVLKPNSDGYIGYEYVGTNDESEYQILGCSHSLINRYATTGRIRWSAAIQGQFAITADQPNVPGGRRIDEDERRTAIIYDREKCHIDGGMAHGLLAVGGGRDRIETKNPGDRGRRSSHFRNQQSFPLTHAFSTAPTNTYHALSAIALVTAETGSPTIPLFPLSPNPLCLPATDEQALVD